VTGSQASLEARLQKLEDIQEISALFMSYRRTLDQREFAVYAELFAPDGEWVGNLGSFKGPAAIKQMLDDSVGTAFGIEPGDDFHLVANPDIRVDGDRATASSMWVFVARDGDDKPQVSLLGHYTDVLARTPDGWRFLRREAYCDVPAEHLGVKQ
jgi:uncharacterized protein (TIGR02246 family)